MSRDLFFFLLGALLPALLLLLHEALNSVQIRQRREAERLWSQAEADNQALRRQIQLHSQNPNDWFIKVGD